MARPRDPFEARSVVSRRGGAVKEPLSRERIVDRALEILTRDGLEEMSLRKVAAALDTGPASLYVYVADIGELHALVLDRALGKVDVRAGSRAGWRRRLQRLLESYVEVLSASPGLARLAFGASAVGPNSMRLVEALLGILAEAGVDRTTSAWAVDLLLLHSTALVAEHAGGPDPAEPEGPLARAIARATERDYPNVHAARAALLSGSPGQRFTWAIDVIVSGVLQTPTPR
ncbi:MAG TPA: TetR/AcrR family transcriptional regulator [Polyangiaceae bacterium]|nr:TetR/AcrR family transcriptional regulator [Polyangiaceae bacterium]